MIKNSIKKELKVFLPITGREILHVVWDQGNLHIKNSFYSFRPLFDQWQYHGIKTDLNTIIDRHNELFLDTMKNEFDKLDFVTILT